MSLNDSREIFFKETKMLKYFQSSMLNNARIILSGIYPTVLTALFSPDFIDLSIKKLIYFLSKYIYLLVFKTVQDSFHTS